MFRTLLKRTGKSAATPKFDRHNRHRRRLAAWEGLEDRTLLSTFTVNDVDDTAGSASDVTLRYAITQANRNPGSTIGFSVTGTIQLASALPALAASVAITGPGANLLSVNAGGHSRVFYIGEGATSTISGLTITGGVAKTGGGVFNGGTLTISDSVISGNHASRGGGGIDNVYAGGSKLTLIGTTISGNSALYGGGIENYGPVDTDSFPYLLTVTNSTISGNTATGGGTYTRRGGVLWDYGGGGVDNFYAAMTVTNSTISGNKSKNDGGGIQNNWGLLIFDSSTISGNDARINGGGVYESVAGALSRQLDHLGQ